MRIDISLSLIIISLIIGILFSPYIIGLLSILWIFLIGMMLSASLMVSINDIIRKGLKISRLGMIIPLQYIGSAAIGYILAYMLYNDANLLFGQVLHASMPSEQTIPVWVRLASGNLALSISALSLSTLLSPLLSPLMVYIFVRESIEIDYLGIISSLVITVIIPVIIGSTIRSKIRKSRMYDHIYEISSLIFALPTVMIIGALAASFISYEYLLTTILLATFLHLISTILMGFYVSKALRWDKQDRPIMVYNLSMKEFTITLSIISMMNMDHLIGLPAAIYGILHIIAAPILARFMR